MARVLVVGGGIAGLWTAVKAADAGYEVVLVTKTELAESNTRYAQGGIAGGAVPRRLRRPARRRHARRPAPGSPTTPPCGCSATRARRACATWSASASRSTAATVGPRTRARGGALARRASCTPEAMPPARRSSRRSWRPCGAGRCSVAERTMLVDLVVEGGAVVGASLLDEHGAITERRADAVVLATGGSGCLYRHTTNPAVATGDGVAAAWRAGAHVADLEFTQFHPTALAAPGTPLISEAVRGEGAVLRDDHGRRFMLDVHPDAELAPRDVVARAVWRQMTAQGGAPVLLDATALGAAFLARRFPGLDAVVREAGFDWSARPCPSPPPRTTPWAAWSPTSTVARACRGCTPSARPPAPACTARIGWHRTPCSRPPSSPTGRPAALVSAHAPAPAEASNAPRARPRPPDQGVRPTRPASTRR